MMIHAQLVTMIRERLNLFCTDPDPYGISIGVNQLDRDSWEALAPYGLTTWGWIDPTLTDDHPSGVMFTYCPEVMADTVARFGPSEVTEYLDALTLYLCTYVRLTNAEPDPDERHRRVEDMIYEFHPNRLAMLSLVQVGDAR